MPAAQAPSRRKHTTFFLMLTETGFDALLCLQSCYGSVVLKAFAVPSQHFSITDSSAGWQGESDTALSPKLPSLTLCHGPKRPRNSRRTRGV